MHSKTSWAGAIAPVGRRPHVCSRMGIGDTGRGGQTEEPVVEWCNGRGWHERDRAGKRSNSACRDAHDPLDHGHPGRVRAALRAAPPATAAAGRTVRRCAPAAVMLLLSLVLAAPAIAHQPHVVGDAVRVVVRDPEVSKAYYARLPGVPARYEISSRRPFILYAQITIPDIAGGRRDYRLTILGPTGQLAQLTTPAAQWKQFFEPFGGDHYLTGPEFRRRVSAGRYTVEVDRPGNRGTYVLAIGEAEVWGPAAAVSALFALPSIKHDYFHQSVLRAWMTRTIPAIAIFLAIVLVVLWFMRRLLRRTTRREASVP